MTFPSTQPLCQKSTCHPSFSPPTCQRVGKSPQPGPPANDSRLDPRPACPPPPAPAGCPRLPLHCLCPLSLSEAYFPQQLSRVLNTHTTLLHKIPHGLLITLEIKPRFLSMTSKIGSDLGLNRPAARSPRWNHARSPGSTVCCVLPQASGTLRRTSAQPERPLALLFTGLTSRLGLGSYGPSSERLFTTTLVKVTVHPTGTLCYHTGLFSYHLKESDSCFCLCVFVFACALWENASI